MRDFLPFFPTVNEIQSKHRIHKEKTFFKEGNKMQGGIYTVRKNEVNRAEKDGHLV